MLIEDLIPTLKLDIIAFIDTTLVSSLFADLDIPPLAAETLHTIAKADKRLSVRFFRKAGGIHRKSSEVRDMAGKRSDELTSMLVGLLINHIYGRNSAYVTFVPGFIVHCVV